MTTQVPELLTPTELCQRLKISARTYHRLVKRGMPFRLVMSARRFELDEVLAWLPWSKAAGRSAGSGGVVDLVTLLKQRARMARRRSA